MVRSYKPGSGLPDASTRWSAKQRALQERAQNRSSRDAAADVFSGEPAASAPLSPTAPVSAQHAQPLDLLEPAAAPPKAPWSHLQVSADRPVEFSFVAKAAAADAKALGSLDSIPAPTTPPAGRVLPGLRAQDRDSDGALSYSPRARAASTAERTRARQELLQIIKFRQRLHSEHVALTADEQRTWADELTERFVAFLRAEGAKFTIAIRPPTGQGAETVAVEISSRGSHPLNRLARALKKGMGVKMALDPLYLFRVVWAGASFNWREGRLWPGFDTITAERPSFSSIVRHEVRHAFRFAASERQRSARKRKRRPSPFYGRMQALGAGTAPKVLGDRYAKAQTIDEMDTYALELRSVVAESITADRRGNATEAKRLAGLAFQRAALGLEMTSRVRAAVRQALRTLARNPSSVEYRTLVDGLFGARIAFKGNPQGDLHYRLEVPLMESKGLNDRSNPALLREQLEWTLAMATHQLTLFRVAQQAAANAKKAGSPGERLAALGALQRVLRDRALERNPSAQPIDFAAAVEKFNQALPEQWQRAEASRGS